MIIKPKTKEFPQIVYIYVDAEDEEWMWLNAKENLKQCATKDAVRLVGVYELRETKRIILKVTEEVIEES